MNRERTEARMGDREALAADIEILDRHLTVLSGGRLWKAKEGTLAAARERLAQLPEKCPTCDGFGFDDPGHVCPTCHGSGKVYTAELVEQIARAIHIIDDDIIECERLAVAVLDTLNGETE